MEADKLGKKKSNKKDSSSSVNQQNSSTESLNKPFTSSATSIKSLDNNTESEQDQGGKEVKMVEMDIENE